jgi:hypothetical protein
MPALVLLDHAHTASDDEHSLIATYGGSFRLSQAKGDYGVRLGVDSDVIYHLQLHQEMKTVLLR